MSYVPRNLLQTFAYVLSYDTFLCTIRMLFDAQVVHENNILQARVNPWVVRAPRFLSAGFFHQVKINCRDTTRWRSPALVPHMRTKMPYKLGAFPPVGPSAICHLSFCMICSSLPTLSSLITKRKWNPIVSAV